MFCFYISGFIGKRRKNLLLPTPEPYVKLFLKKEDVKKKKAAEEQLQGEEKGVLLLPEDFLCTPLIFMSCNEWTEIQPPLLYLHAQFYDCDEKRS